MKKNGILKLFGIVGGILIVLGVFLPFIKTSEFSISLWKTFMDNKQIYLSIVIIVFGLIPIVLNLIGKKIEFTYTSIGALTFFLIIEILGTISDLNFGTLNLGFYSIVIGTIFITINTVILGKKTKMKNISKEKVSASNVSENESMDDPVIFDLQNNQDGDPDSFFENQVQSNDSPFELSQEEKTNDNIQSEIDVFGQPK